MPSPTTHIDTVEQVDLAPIRPGRGWYAAGSLVIGAGLVIGFFLLASGAFGYLRDLSDLTRIEVPGTGEAVLAPGTVTVFHEPEGGPVVAPGGYDLEILDPAGTVVVPRPPSSPDQYVVEGRRGWAVAEFEAPVEGRYRFTVGAGATGQLAVGPSPTERLATFGVAGMIVAGSALLVGVATLLVTRRKRARSTAARLDRQRANPVVERLT